MVDCGYNLFFYIRWRTHALGIGWWERVQVEPGRSRGAPKGYRASGPTTREIGGSAMVWYEMTQWEHPRLREDPFRPWKVECKVHAFLHEINPL